jgi:hypothetical protein
MNVTRNVIEDLLPAYLAGEASQDTIALVEEFLRQDADLARHVEGLSGNPLAELPEILQPTYEKETLDMTKRLLRWRSTLMGLALFLTLFPFTVHFSSGRVTWVFLEGAPAALAAIVLSAVACWGGFFYVRSRLQGTSL